MDVDEDDHFYGSGDGVKGTFEQEEHLEPANEADAKSEQDEEGLEEGEEEDEEESDSV